ncbi:MAG: hypothetical protein WCF19_01850, partial [Chlamydiales bacterium]
MSNRWNIHGVSSSKTFQRGTLCHNKSAKGKQYNIFIGTLMVDIRHLARISHTDAENLLNLSRHLSPIA